MAEIIKDKILIVDDEPQVRELLTLNFRDEYLVSTAATVKEASAKIQNEKFSLVITDMNMAGEKGRDVIHLVKTVSPETIVLAITGYGSVEDAVNAVKLGAEEYFLKPLDLERFNLTVKNHMEKFHLNRQLNKNSRLLELEKASRAVLEAEVIEVSLPDILKMILGMFKADSGSVMLFDKNSEQLVVSASEGLSNLAQESLRVSDGAKISGWAAKHNRPLLLGPDPEKSKKILGDFEPRNEINSSLVVPLAIRGKPLGVLNLNMLSDVKRFNEEDMDIVTIFSMSFALSIENARVKRELIENNERLKEMDKLKTDLISNVSHELRTPLTAMKGSLDLLLLQKLGISEDSAKLLGIMKNNLNRQIHLVTDLLEYSRIEGNRINIEKVESDAVGIVKEAVDEMGILFGGSKLSIKQSIPSKPLFFKFDPGRIKQVLINLLSNSMKYTQRGGIEVILEDKTDSVIFSVKDTGCGIPLDQRPNIFTRFFRVDNEITRNTQGLGLGLSIAKGIIESHGGKIWFESPEKGTIFSFLLYK